MSYLIAGNARLAGKFVKCVSTRRLFQALRRDRLIGSAPDPGLSNIPVAALLKPSASARPSPR